MAMITCPECGNSISTRANCCIKCGLPMNEIFICPECNNVILRKNNNHCPNCGCPVEDSSAKEQKNSIVEEYDDDIFYSKYSNDVFEIMIEKVLAHHSFSIGYDLIYESGFPIKDLQRVRNAKIAFDIPDKDNVYFIVNGNIIRKITANSKGFAISSSGFYFCDDDRKKESFDWYRLVDFELSKSFGFLKIGNFQFNFAQTKKILDMLWELQIEIENYLNT